MPIRVASRAPLPIQDVPRARRRGLRRSPRRPGLLAALLVLVGIPASAPAADPFEVRALRVPGRPLEAFAAPSATGPPWVVVLSVSGDVPREERHVTLFDLRTPGAPGRRLDVGPGVVAVDAADLAPPPGPELALLSSRTLRVYAPGQAQPLLERVLDPPLPLPPRARGLARLGLLDRWSGDATLSALVPALGGLRHVPLAGPSRLLPSEVRAEYLVLDPAVGLRSGLEATLTWPDVALGDDDGDGRLDLFVLSRYALAVFRNGDEGLPATPSRSVALEPFSAEEERRHRATSLSMHVRDLDGDGLADLVLHRTVGTLLKSHATASIFRNRGGGADPSLAPDATLGEADGFGSLFVDDFDGDGRAELLQTLVPFGVLQVVRVLVTAKAQAVFRMHRFGPELTPLKTWEDSLTLPLDFDAGRVAGVLPTLAGDWNGDGVRDLLYGESPQELVIRLGERTPDGPRVGGVVARQPVPGAEQALVADLDGDGLDDALVWDSESDGGRVHALRNAGVLRGTAPGLRAPAAQGR